jgi:spore germination protein KB
MPFAFTLFAILLALLIPEYNAYNLLPWQGTGLSRAIKEGITHGGVNTGAMILAILAPAFQNVQTLRTATVLGITLTGLLRASLVLVFTLVFGVQVGREKVIPFYEMARLVYLSRFIQHIEALLIILWVIVGVISIAASLYVSVYLVVRLLKLPAMQPMIPVSTIIMVELAQLQPDVISVIRLDNQATGSWLNTGVYLIPILLTLLTFWKRKRGKASCATDA